LTCFAHTLNLTVNRIKKFEKVWEAMEDNLRSLLLRVTNQHRIVKESKGNVGISISPVPHLWTTPRSCSLWQQDKRFLWWW
jgi:hypothetical protein